MTDSDHPTYQSPTIQEALCEIFYRPQSGHPWTPLTPLEFFQAVKPDFPNVESLPVPTVQLQIGPGGSVSSTAVPTSAGILRYRHASRPLMLQASENRLVVNCLGNYPGWNRLRRDIQDAWEKLSAIAHPEVITRVGLRYINRIERRTENETLAEWLVSTDYVPQAVLTSLPGFVSQVQVRTDATNRMSVTIGEQDTPGSSLVPFIFDIDRISENEVSPDVNSLLQKVDLLHTDVWNVFSTAKGARLEKVLRGELL